MDKKFHKISQEIKYSNDYNQIHNLLKKCSEIIFDIQIDKIKEDRDIFFQFVVKY